MEKERSRREKRSIRREDTKISRLTTTFEEKGCRAPFFNGEAFSEGLHGKVRPGG